MKNTWLKKKYSIFFLLLVPSCAQAAITNLQTLFSGITTFISTYVIGVVVGIGVLIFLWGIFGYVASAGDEKKRTESKAYMLYGIIGIFVMISVWGLVAILSDLFEFSTVPLPPK